MNEENIREFVIQPNAISRSIYSASTYARRLMAMAMSLIPLEPSKATEKDYTVQFTNYEFLKSLGLEDGKKQRWLIIDAIGECMSNKIQIWGEEKYEAYTWFTHASCPLPDKYSTHDKIKMSFNPRLAEVIGEFKKAYSYINLLNFGKLQGKYAIRIYEYVLSWQGIKNKKNEWTTPIKTIADMRLLFDVGTKYKITNNFRTFVIDYPVEEINEADIGLYIKPIYEHRRKTLFGVRFLCRLLQKGDPRPVEAVTLTRKEQDKLISDYPEEWDRIKKEAVEHFKKNPLLFGKAMEIEDCADIEARERLCKLHLTTGKRKKKA